MNELIVSFSHSNYNIRSAGTEKFVKELSQTLIEKGYNHLNFFSFYNSYGSKIVGVNYNDEFVGIYKYEEIDVIIDCYVMQYALNLCAIHFQHLLNHQIEVLQAIVTKYKVPVYIVIHDYYMVCNRLKLIDSNGNFCGLSEPNEKKCLKCIFGKIGIAHYNKYYCFLKKIDKYIAYIVCPSEYVAKGMRSVYLKFSDKIIVRPHLLLEGQNKYVGINKKIRIAYAGWQNESKGYDEWKYLVQYLKENCPDSYEFFYFGTGKEILEDVTNIYVSIAEQGENAMLEKLKENKIDCAFLWPRWAETYSYIYYEFMVSGAYVITNDVSGNICDEVEKHKNGVVFNSLKDCIEWLEDKPNVRNSIENYRKSGIAFPEKYSKNSSLKEFIPAETVNVSVKSKIIKPHRRLILSKLYSLKYRKYLRKVM